MDPFEEFEFKPLTEGLGFHKKKVELGEELKGAGVVAEQLGKALPQSPKRLFGINEEKKTQGSAGMDLNTPLPTKSNKQPAKPAHRSDVIDELIKNFRQPKIEFNEKAILSKDLKEKTQKPVSWSLFPFVIDSMMVLAMTLFCLIIALTTTRIDFVRSLMSRNTDPLFFVSLAAMLLSMGVVYLTITRAFLGGSLGELVFDVQSGADMQQQHPLYPIRVIGRSMLVMGTGLVTLPLLSMVTRTDLAGRLTGTSLVQKD